MQGNFIQRHIQEDLGEAVHLLRTRFPPEPSGYPHIGHAKSICINFGLAALYGGRCNLRIDDTDPTKENMAHYVEALKNAVLWLGFEWDGFFYASDYFEKLYEYALVLIRKGVAYICELDAEQMREFRGTLTEAGRNSPFRERPIDENLDLFARMKAGEFPNGAYTLRAKIDMTSPNMNMRDPVIYRIIHHEHYNAPGWCIYPTYDYAHPLEDAIEGITHSLCGLEFENNRPLYDWYLDQIGGFSPRPRQIEFAELHLSNTVLGKRFIRKLIQDGIVDDWDDPRLATISGMSRRGYSAAAVRNFCDEIGLSKAQSRVDIAMLEHFVREDLNLSAKVIMAVLNPVKLVITNYPEGQVEWLEIANNPKNPELGTRQVPFGREIYIEAEDFMIEPAPKYHRLAPGREVRLAGAYFVKCTDFIADESGRVIEIHATYDPETKSGTGFNARKVKGTIHWVAAAHAMPICANLYDYLVIDDENAEDGYIFNENSLEIVENALAEPAIREAKEADRYQFMRNAFYCLDPKTSTTDKVAFNRIVEIKSSYKPNRPI
ncbi:MAG: glutamine--tRNA ligase/YqeY domain fusion protein [Clostridiales bacterium]|jgi:glutaminyl-tRNA synthetase|nr:glutamine--tRNA ligase/YqeY domain fusion protein [Clostridiales bacterium]